MRGIPALRRLTQDNWCEITASLGYTVRPFWLTVLFEDFSP